jgi:hypothetical protein
MFSTCLIDSLVDECLRTFAEHLVDLITVRVAVLMNISFNVNPELFG